MCEEVIPLQSALIPFQQLFSPFELLGSFYANHLSDIVHFVCV